VRRAHKTFSALILWLVVSTSPVLGDGMVFSPPVYPKVEIPNQQAMIHFADGVERLVIETTFLGEGTNFAWVVPLPAAPNIKPVAEGFFDGLRQTFQPRLIHEVHRYYAAVLLLCAWAFLGWRSFKDEVSWVADLPLCLALAGAIWFLGRHFALGLIAFGLALHVRLFTRSTAALTLEILVGAGLAALIMIAPSPSMLGLVTMSGEGAGLETPEVTVVSVQRAGVFDATTIRSPNPHAVMEWLERNGYAAPDSIGPAIRYYVDHGWVFVASKVRRESAGNVPTALHPLLFEFATKTPVYPLRLTGVGGDDCTIDLYAFANGRAKARHFSVARCERVAHNWNPKPRQPWNVGLRITDSDLAGFIGKATVGTKLTAKLGPKQMNSDVEVKWTGFSHKGTNVYSYSGAFTVALNAAVPLAALGWLLMGASRGGLGVDEKFISRWRWRLLLFATIVGIAVYLLLPKVEVVVG